MGEVEDRIEEAWALAKRVYRPPGGQTRARKRAHYEAFKNAFVEEAAARWEMGRGDVRRIVERRVRGR